MNFFIAVFSVAALGGLAIAADLLQQSGRWKERGSVDVSLALVVVFLLLVAGVAALLWGL